MKLSPRIDTLSPHSQPAWGTYDYYLDTLRDADTYRSLAFQVLGSLDTIMAVNTSGLPADCDRITVMRVKALLRAEAAIKKAKGWD